MWGLVIFVALILALSASVAALRRHQAPVPASVFFRQTALLFLAAFTLLTGVFIIAETFSEPGGWQAAGLICLWLAPLAVLSALAWRQPGWATVALAVLLAGVVALAFWYVADPAWWRALEGSHGPIRAVSSFILTLPAALVGWRRPLAGAVLLLVLGTGPVLISAAGSGHAAASLAAVSGPPVLGGVLCLLAAFFSRREAHLR